ncbi:MAG: hypothetical protein PHV68_04865 [Candidatus Gastranaerophilales bacterium]|nr:hypothetical protein [Candidatus Gastranaerophilales bacterium]
MDNNISKLYPQYQNDRRQNNRSVDVERRSGIDRREDSRISNDKFNSDIQKFQITINENNEKKPLIDTFDKTVSENKESTEVLFKSLSPIAPVRRISSLPDKLENHDYLSALGLSSLALVNLPEDLRDIKGAINQIRSKIDKNFIYDPLYNRKTHQHSFSFFRGTMLDEPLQKQIDKGNIFAEKLDKLDRKTIYETKLGEKIQNFFGIEANYDNITVVDGIKNAAGKKARAYEFTAKKLGGEITARAIKRIPLLSVIALGILELPKIFKSHNKGDNIADKVKETGKQTLKSGINVTSVLTGIGYGGAIGAKHGGAVGSLIGMGAGAVFGSEVSKKIQDLID